MIIIYLYPSIRNKSFAVLRIVTIEKKTTLNSLKVLCKFRSRYKEILFSFRSDDLLGVHNQQESQRLNEEAQKSIILYQPETTEAGAQNEKN